MMDDEQRAVSGPLGQIGPDQPSQSAVAVRLSCPLGGADGPSEPATLI